MAFTRYEGNFINDKMDGLGKYFCGRCGGLIVSKLKADSKIPAQSVPASGAGGNLCLISASPVFAPQASGKIPAQSVPASGAGGSLSS